MTLTKAELADMLFEQVGLNKREAKDMEEAFLKKFALPLKQEMPLSCQALVILNYAKNPSVQDAILKQARKYQSLHVVL